jgi:hypothetical protein
MGRPCHVSGERINASLLLLCGSAGVGEDTLCHAQLLVTELVTNASRHAHSAVDLTVAAEHGPRPHRGARRQQCHPGRTTSRHADPAPRASVDRRLVRGLGSRRARRRREDRLVRAGQQGPRPAGERGAPALTVRPNPLVPADHALPDVMRCVARTASETAFGGGLPRPSAGPRSAFSRPGSVTQRRHDVAHVVEMPEVTGAR